MKRKVLISKYILLLILIVSLFSYPALADSTDYTEFEERFEVPINKTWTITFSKNVTMENIEGIVIREGDSFIPVKIDLDGSNVHVTPIGTYKYNTRYNMRIFLSNNKKYSLYFNTVKSPSVIIPNPSKVFKGYFENADYSSAELYLQYGEQTKITPRIQSIADKFNDKKDISTIREIYTWIKKNMVFDSEFAEKFGRTSDELFESNRLTGCTDYGLAFIALTRAKGIPSVFIQAAKTNWISDRVSGYGGSIEGHIFVEVYLNNKWYIVDSTAGKLFLDYDINNFSLSDNYYIFAKSLEVYDSGVRNEKENWNVMMDLFKSFELNLYKNPKYRYIDLISGETLNSYDSSVTLNNKFIIGHRFPCELFHSRFGGKIVQASLSSIANVVPSKIEESSLVIYLYTKDQRDSVPQFMLDLFPEIDGSQSTLIVNRYENGKKLVLIKASTEEELMNIIKELPEDFIY